MSALRASAPFARISISTRSTALLSGAKGMKNDQFVSLRVKRSCINLLHVPVRLQLRESQP